MDEAGRTPDPSIWFYTRLDATGRYGIMGAQATETCANRC